MRNLLLAKMERNYERIETWEYCKIMATQYPELFRIRYEDGNFYLEKFMKTIAGMRWLRTIISEPEK